MLNCHRATQLLSRIQDGKVTLSERASLRVHLLLCSGCRNFNQQINTLRMITHTYTRFTPEKPQDKP